MLMLPPASPHYPRTLPSTRFPLGCATAAVSGEEDSTTSFQLRPATQGSRQQRDALLGVASNDWMQVS